MWKCRKCGKPVYFAERRQSIGFDWHRQCLTCEECGKVLHPGQHAEHKEKPYCYIPCYSALFGPKLFGHGSTVESHRSFGNRGKKLMVDRDFERKVRDYNEHVEKIGGSSKLELTSRLVNDRLVLEGVLRIFWGVQRSIRVKEFEDKRVIAKRPLSTISLDSERNDGVVLRNKGKVESSNFYRHSVHQVPVNQSFANNWHRNNIPSWQDEMPETPRNQSWNIDESESNEITQIWSKNNVPSQDVVQRTLLHRTLSDSNLLSAMPAKSSSLWLRSSYQTLPQNFGRAKPVVLPLHLDRYEGLSDLTKGCSTLTFDLTSLQPDILQRQDSDYDSLPPTHDDIVVIDKQGTLKKNGHRGLRRRHGRKFNKNTLRRRSSFNGHWYDRETSVFTPPKDSCMSVWITSLVQTREVIQMVLDKYKVESEPDRFALFVVKETGERRIVGDSEYPLVLRVNLGPYDEIARLYIFDKNQTSEVNHEVAQYLRFSYTECRSILNMFYEEEEREVDYIRRKYKLMKKIISNLLVAKWEPRQIN